MGKKSEGDKIIQERIRAHIRARMTRLGIGPTAAGALLGCHQATVSNILLGYRGFGVGFADRVANGFNVDHMVLFKDDPPAEFFRPYVPNAGPEVGAGKRKRRIASS